MSHNKTRFNMLKSWIAPFSFLKRGQIDEKQLKAVKLELYRKTLLGCTIKLLLYIIGLIQSSNLYDQSKKQVEDGL